VPELRSGYEPQHREARLARLVGRQHGVVHFEQLLALGFSRSWIKRAKRSGRLISLHRGVYAVSSLAIGLEGRAMAGQLAGGELATVCRDTAAALLGIRRDRAGPVHLALPHYRRNRRGLVFHEGTLSHDDTRIWRNITITSVERTLIDLGDTLTTDELEKALSEARRLGHVDFERLKHSPGRKGMTAVLARGFRMTRSDIERAFLTDLRAAGDVPLPETNVGLHGFEADMYWRAHDLVAEIDDYLTHGDRLAFERDRRKQNAYLLAGLQTLRVTQESLPGAVGAVRALTTGGSRARSRRG
jgi:putative AbiEi antitoxin of type IV toxin-antitoxin system